ncbi:MAG: hypothetical protein C4567_11785 [Deltaproteobacteria bacterium]|nr:MAG: hypothetical protein C4567_11785 [Deltaproteobacteria bacterium]
MKPPSRRYCPRAFGLLAAILAVTVICWLTGGWIGPVEAKLTPATEPVQEPIGFDANHPRVQAALSAQHRHGPRLMAEPEVVGTATGLDNADEPTVVVYTRQAVAVGAIPPSVDGIPVTVKVTGEIRPMQADYFPRPVPIGVSVGNKRECAAGTIGCRVKDAAGKVYILSNNHVLAMENVSPLGVGIAQPGLFDAAVQCVYSTTYLLGKLYDFEPISFTQNNIMDAAIASTNKSKLGNATPNDGYGKPKTTTAAAAIGQQVQKYGRTTGHTLGAISAINATFDINYGTDVNPRFARFVNQIVVSSPTAFILPGDSGSLLVTNLKKPVGLLFAGNGNGTLAIANPINPVLQRFGVTIDGRVPPQ